MERLGKSKEERGERIWGMIKVSGGKRWSTKRRKRKEEGSEKRKKRGRGRQKARD